jgi:hypothetical protein
LLRGFLALAAVVEPRGFVRAYLSRDGVDQEFVRIDNIQHRRDEDRLVPAPELSRRRLGR